MKKIFILIACLALISSCTGSESSSRAAKKMLILGFDGMDPVMLDKYMTEGVMPNFKALKEKGDFKSLATSMPPQSPVAWSDLITGMNPGGHGIFDFIARDPLTYSPYLSTSKTTDAKKSLSVGEWVFPISEAETTLMRRGKAFWKILEEHGIPATVLHVPANFPPEETKAKTISGMGTPDIKGTYGTFSFYTTRDLKNKKSAESGIVFQVELKNNIIKTELTGSPNTFKKEKPMTAVPLIIKVDPENPVALIQVQDKEFILREGEWSDWVNVEFKLIPLQKVNGICRFHLSKVHPYLELYVTPVNIDPSKPILP
ncbi:MAG: alkaline phosphatase family protein, partial [Nitrospirae bacterium]|nr:alkaline phosphatase family protein [Nitrospirota bacterium]